MGHHYIKRFVVEVEPDDGEVSERFKELVLKTSDSERGRGFESHPLRQRCDKWEGIRTEKGSQVVETSAGRLSGRATNG